MSAFRDEKHKNMFLSSSDLNLPSPIQSIHTYMHKTHLGTSSEMLHSPKHVRIATNPVHESLTICWLERQSERERQLCPWSRMAHKIVTLIEAAGGQIVKNPKGCSAGVNHRAAAERHTWRERELGRSTESKR